MNGWCYNPTSLQFRWALRKLLCHAGTGIIHSPSANCIRQDETVLMQISNLQSSRLQIISTVEREESTETHLILDLDEEYANDEMPLHSNGCNPQDCRLCTPSLSYIAGYFVKKLQRTVKCSLCRDVLSDSQSDPCTDRTLIYVKNYVSSKHGLNIPSGSMCRLILLCEKE